jgi:hypothetical protein
MGSTTTGEGGGDGDGDGGGAVVLVVVVVTLEFLSTDGIAFCPLRLVVDNHNCCALLQFASSRFRFQFVVRNDQRWTRAAAAAAAAADADTLD